MNRDENFEAANVELMATELDRLLVKYKDVLDFHDRLDLASLVSNKYGHQVKGLDKAFFTIVPKYKQIMNDPEVNSLANRFIEFADRYNSGEKAGQEFDVRNFQGASLNEVRDFVRRTIRTIGS